MAITINGQEAADSLSGGLAAETINGLGGNDTFRQSRGADTLNGGDGSDSFHFDSDPYDGTTIDGGTDAGKTSDAVVTLKRFTLPDGTVKQSGTTYSTVQSTVAYDTVDTIFLDKSLDFSGVSFVRIEKIALAEGVEATFEAEQLDEAIESLGGSTDVNSQAVNPGLHFYGTPGGKAEKVIVEVGLGGDLQLDDASVGDLFHDAQLEVHFEGGETRFDGTNDADIVHGGDGTDYMTSRLGNDTLFGGEGNDILAAHGGADRCDGGEGNDIFLIARVSKNVGSIAKAEDGEPDWIPGDVMDGGAGIDELRINAAAVQAGDDTIVLNDANFKNVERVVVGANKSRDATKFDNVQQQMAAGDFSAVRTGTAAVNVDASAVKAKAGIEFYGNAGANKLFGGAGNDSFDGGGGSDVFKGGSGKDRFALDLTLSGETPDQILDFKSGQDKLVLHKASFGAFSGAVGKDNLIQGAGVKTAKDADDYLIFDTADKILYYDADGSGGASAPVALVSLTGLAALKPTDIEWLDA